jgi:hypothetical protein
MKKILYNVKPALQNNTREVKNECGLLYRGDLRKGKNVSDSNKEIRKN